MIDQQHYALALAAVSLALTCRGCGCSFERDVRRRNAKFCGRSCVGRAGGKASGEHRFTKPVSPSPDNGICALRKRFPGLSDDELYRSGAVPPVALLQIRYSESGAA